MTKLEIEQQPTQQGISVSLNQLLALRQAAAQINLSSLSKSQAVLSGAQTSRLRGRGIDFAEVRIYEPGDDIRHMDWRVTARTGKPHTKVFQEERERPIFIVVDYGPSMFFGTKQCYKSVVAAKVASLLAFAGINNGDRIGGLIFCGKQYHECRPQSGMRGVLSLLKQLINKEVPDTDKIDDGALASAIKRIRRVARPGSLIFILSDFLSLDREAERHLSHLNQHNDIVAGLIYDPLEKDPPPADRYSISDGEMFSVLDTTAKDFCNSYRAYFQQHHDHLLTICRQRKITLLNISTAQDMMKLFKRFDKVDQREGVL